MTKKSDARLKRDELKKEAKNWKTWDELETLYKNFCIGLTEPASSISELYKTPGLIDYLNPAMKDEIIIRLKGFGADINAFADKLNRIHALHSGHTGSIDPTSETVNEDLNLILNCYNDYSNYQLEFEGLIMPNIAFLLEQAECAVANMNADMENQRSKDATDPSVVTDVVAKNETQVN